MARAINLAANPLRLLLLFAMLLYFALLVGFSVNQPPISNAGSHSQPPSMFVTEPSAGLQPPADAAANQATPVTSRIVTGSTNGPGASAPPAAVDAAQAAPAGSAGCQANPPAGRGTPVICSNP